MSGTFTFRVVLLLLAYWNWKGTQDIDFISMEEEERKESSTEKYRKKIKTYSTKISLKCPSDVNRTETHSFQNQGRNIVLRIVLNIYIYSCEPLSIFKLQTKTFINYPIYLMLHIDFGRWWYHTASSLMIMCISLRTIT